MAHDEELFLNPSSSSPSNLSETPKPLRINKPISPPRAGGLSDSTSAPQQQWAQYRVPPPSSALFGAPQSPPPTKPLPLPYPDERLRRHDTPNSLSHHEATGGVRAPSRTHTPNDERSPGSQAQLRPRKASMSSEASSGGSGSRRPRFDANDPNRPTIHGYGVSPPPLQTGRPQPDRRAGAIRAAVPPDSPGGPEPPHKSDDEDHDDEDEEEEDHDLFQVQPRRGNAAPATNDYQHFQPPPLSSAPSGSSANTTNRLHIPDPSGINRLGSTASVSTTRASRGSPPPPETPILPPGLANGLPDIEARYAASGIPGTETLNEIQAQSAAAAARRAQYAAPQPRQGTLNAPALQQPRPAQPSQPSTSGRWSPTETPGSAPHGPPIAFQGTEEVSSRGESVPNQTRARQPSYPRPPQPSTSPNLEGDMGRMALHDEPPPAYSPPEAGSVHSPYPNEKGQRNPQSPASVAESTASDGSRRPTVPNMREHPAFANRTASEMAAAGRADQAAAAAAATQQNGGVGSSSQAAGVPAGALHAQHSGSPQPSVAGSTVSGPLSPPPLPEGWIAHLDANSGQYYYIHLPTQSTQWEFPKGPTPLNLQEPTSPTTVASPVGSIFKNPLASPGMPVHQLANYDRQSMYSMSNLASPTTTGFTGPPPSAGIDMYNTKPSNGVYFGPYLRYTNMDIERGLWLGSILLITDVATPAPTIHIHQSLDLSPNPRQLKAHPIHSHQRWMFYRYDVDLRMEDHAAAKWTYAITSHLGCTRYEFLVAGRQETSWRFIAHSKNDFSIGVSAQARAGLGGLQPMWKDVLLKHQECGGFHAQVGLGGQISADRLWKDIPALKQWTQISGKDNRRTAPWTAKLEEDVSNAYFHFYTSHFDQPAVKEAFAQIPSVCCLDDQDIFDGYGSYPEYMQTSHMFRNLGRIGIDMYLLFQHHTTHEILRNVSNDIDLFTITGQGWHFLKYFGPGVVVVGPDTRSERGPTQVMAGSTYQGLFPKVAVLPPSVQHCIWLLPVPVVYPRLEGIEQMANTVATGKKVVTGGFNMLGKVAGGVAGVVGAKGVVSSGFDGVKKAVGKSGLMSGVLSPFGEIDMLDELRDMWTHESKDLERTYIIRTLQGVAHTKSLRMTFLSGGVSACGAGLVHDPSRPQDHKTMYQLITAPIVDAPAANYVVKLLHNSAGRALYVPANGHRSNANPTDTREDMMEIFAADVDGRPREMRRLMARRNYLACVAYDPEVVQGAFTGGSPELGKGGQGAGRLSLAADFMVQGDGAYGQPMKYGPVIIPSLEYGR